MAEQLTDLNPSELTGLLLAGRDTHATIGIEYVITRAHVRMELAHNRHLALLNANPYIEPDNSDYEHELESAEGALTLSLARLAHLHDRRDEIEDKGSASPHAARYAAIGELFLRRLLARQQSDHTEE